MTAMNTKIPLAPYVMFALALIGLVDAFYLAHASYTGASLSCAIFEGCNTVAQSAYTRMLGVPLSYLGVLYYLGVLALASLLAYDPFSRGMRLGILLYSVLGVGYSAYFEYLQVFKIDAICIYCLGSAVTTVLLLGAAWWHWRSARVPAELLD